eukprot:COSAG06_NODE_13376_length_1263_cov_2.012887_2_plen_64_part_00
MILQPYYTLVHGTVSRKLTPGAVVKVHMYGRHEEDVLRDGSTAVSLARTFTDMLALFAALALT